MAEAVKIAIIMDGGVIQAVLTAGVPVRYVVVDYDTDGATGDDGVIDVPQGDGTTSRAFVHACSADPDGSFVLQAFELAGGSTETDPPAMESERFTGGFVWMTIGGGIWVDHPDGRRFKTGPIYGSQYEICRTLPKGAEVEVEIPAQVPGAGVREPFVVSFPGRDT